MKSDLPVPTAGPATLAEINIRPERPFDQVGIRRVVEAAFGREAESALVDALRRSPAFIEDLSLVAEHGPDVVGHVLFTRVRIMDGDATHPAIALAPLAVLPMWQSRGVGSALVGRALDDARRLGHDVAIVQGHPAYYPRFGFEVARPHGISSPFPAADEAFMVLALQPGALAGVRGEVQYAPEFFQM